MVAFPSLTHRLEQTNPCLACASLAEQVHVLGNLPATDHILGWVCECGFLSLDYAANNSRSSRLFERQPWIEECVSWRAGGAGR